MEENKKDQPGREPFKPEDTPEPPQVMDTSREPDRDEHKSKPSNSTQPKNKPAQPDKDQKAGEKLLGESPIEIDDETTI